MVPYVYTHTHTYTDTHSCCVLNTVSECHLNSRALKCLIDFKDYTGVHTSNTSCYHGNHKITPGLRSTIIWNREKEGPPGFSPFYSKVFAQCLATLDLCQRHTHNIMTIIPICEQNSVCYL